MTPLQAQRVDAVTEALAEASALSTEAVCRETGLSSGAARWALRWLEARGWASSVNSPRLTSVGRPMKSWRLL